MEGSWFSWYSFGFECRPTGQDTLPGIGVRNKIRGFWGENKGFFNTVDQNGAIKPVGEHLPEDFGEFHVV
jgi:hypothetical protein